MKVSYSDLRNQKENFRGFWDGAIQRVLRFQNGVFEFDVDTGKSWLE